MGQGVIKAIPNRPNGGMYLPANQLNLVDNVWTVIWLGNTIKTGFTDGIEGILGGAMADAIYPNVPGFYAIFAQIWFSGVVAAKAYMARVFDFTAAATLLNTVVQSDNFNNVSANLSDVVYLAGNEALTLDARPVNVGGNVVDALGGTEYQTFLTVQRVR